ncbi:MAG: Rab family GTPase, partial [Candidatus Heimdallarchaeota archaeon]
QAQIEINENLTLDAQIWDIAGQDSLETITNQFLAGTQGAIFVFDLTREYTFEKINSWLDRLHSENPELENNIPFLIVGNKSDLEIHIKMDDQDVVNYIEYVDRHQVYSKTPTKYIKTSAKTGFKVKEAFKRMGEIIIRNFQELDGTYIPPEVDSEKVSKLEGTLVPAKIMEEAEVKEVLDPEPVKTHTPETMTTPAPTPAPTSKPESVVEKTHEPVKTHTPETMTTPAPTPAPTPKPEPVIEKTHEPVKTHSPTPPSPPITPPKPEPVVETTPEPEPSSSQTRPVWTKPKPAFTQEKSIPKKDDRIVKSVDKSPIVKKSSSGGLTDQEIAELIKQKDKRKKKFFGKN